MNDKRKLIAVAKLSNRGTSIRMTLPKDVFEFLDMRKNESFVFYGLDGVIFVR